MERLPIPVDPQVQQWFQAVDSDRSGKITSRELQQALVNGNWSHFSDEACRLMIAMFDRDNSGTIDIYEFQQLWNYIHQWKSIFERYDADRTGHIEQQELMRALSDMQYRLSPNFVSTAIAKFDRTRKSLTFDNFIVFCVQLKLITDAFMARDTNRSGQITIGYEDFLSLAILNKP
ncbi:PEF1 [Cordylochernes scorpioides]|uniref:PEF1 n=1 Tax=Cordylochernes scorpioides TaxID=51811 RepID=A0ABY6KAR4_9ARAC|nr:PEF1 [Cordylochernes scorpioides]